jgi:hypothetical protein
MARLEAVIIVAGAFVLIGACGQSLDDRTAAASKNQVVANAPTEVETVPPDDSSDDKATDDSSQSDDQATDDSDSSDQATDDSDSSDDATDDSQHDDSSDTSSDDQSSQ